MTRIDLYLSRWFGLNVYFSSVSTLFSWMQLAMMMTEERPMPLLERSITLVAVTPLSSSIGSGEPSTLPAWWCHAVKER